MRIVINQSNYIPWKGYFDLIHDADVFVFYDDVQFTKNDWRNRNRVKTADGPQWMTVPVGRDLNRRINEVTLPDHHWQGKHWRTLEQLYGKAPFFDRYREFLAGIYLGRQWDRLSDLNQTLIQWVAGELGITTRIMHSHDVPVGGSGANRVLGIAQAIGASEYVSGPAGRAYLDPAAFADAGITLTWKSYDSYPEYAQFHPPFEHAVTVLDLLFHTGPGAPHYIWGWRDAARTMESHAG